MLLVLEGTVERDIFGVDLPARTDAAVLRATRYYVALFALVTAVIALNPPGGIVTLTALSGAMYGACFFPAIVLGLYWRKGSGAAVIGSYAAGLAPLFLWQYTPWSEALHQVFPALALSLLTYVVISLVGPTIETERIRDLFQAAEGSRSP